jgi:ankyrin repeat protein
MKKFITEHKIVGVSRMFRRALARYIPKTVHTSTNVNTISWLHIRSRENVRRGDTLLLVASQAGALDIVQWLVLQKSHSLYETNFYGDTALMVAARAGHLSVVKWVCKQCSDLDRMQRQTNTLGTTALLQAVRKKQLAVVRWLIQSGTCRVTDPPNTVITLIAAETGDLQMLQWLLGPGGVSVSARSRISGGTALMFAAARGHISVVRWLLSRADGDVDAVSHAGDTALMWAACRGRLKMVQYLAASAGADVYNTNKSGSSVFTNAGVCLHWLLIQYPRGMHYISACELTRFDTYTLSVWWSYLQERVGVHTRCHLGRDLSNIVLSYSCPQSWHQ